MRFVDAIGLWLDRFTMRTTVLVALSGMLASAAFLSLIGVLGYSALEILGATLLSVSVGVITNAVLARLVKATTSLESTVITALILTLIVPVGLRDHGVFLVLATVAAIGSKYIVTVDRQHFLNPAAAGVVAITLLFPNLVATWWIGTLWMLPAVVVLGGVIMLKMRRTEAVVTFLVVYAVISTSAEIGEAGGFSGLAEAWRLRVSQTALLFFALVMLTDPITMPAGRKLRAAYVSLIALLYATPEVNVRAIALTPEQTLCIVNLVSFLIHPKYHLLLRLNRKWNIGHDTWAFQFTTNQRMEFTAGQYMEWTVPHANPDHRGQSRYFTIASSPTDDDLTIMMRVPDSSSTFKRSLLDTDGLTSIVATRLAGDFVLPADKSRPLAFIAGGVGVAPFVSMAKHMLAVGESRDIVLLYATRYPEEIAFRDTLEEVAALGWRVVFFLTDRTALPEKWTGKTGRITAEAISHEIPDFSDRAFYLSGSFLMVNGLHRSLRQLGVRRSDIHWDLFDGLEDS